MDEKKPPAGLVRSSDLLGPAVDAALAQYALAVWHDTEPAIRERYADLEDAVRARIGEMVAAERERCARIVEDMVRAVDGADALAAIRGA